MTLTQDNLLDLVVGQYLDSQRFNGLAASVVLGRFQTSLEELRDLLTPLIESAQVSVLFGDIHPNPHIRAFRDEPAEKQIAKLINVEIPQFVIYPASETLARRVDARDYAGRPFTLRLALGAGQLDFASFELPVLEYYRRDPRYHFWCNDIQGSISIGNEAYESDSFPEKHKVLLQAFGFSYNADYERAVAAFLWDLHRLTPEHQQIWAAHEVQGGYKLHPDFYRAQILGDWEIKASLADAFLEEVRVINRMCKLIGWKPLFRKVFEKPREFAFLLRSTRRELNEFVLLLDKMMSDNLNVDFFPTQIARSTEETQKDGKVIVRQRGTIAMLEEWLNTTFRTSDADAIPELLAAFREIRELRQKPAHAVNQDAYDPGLFKEQRRIFLLGYNAVRTLRLILANHPRARSAEGEMDQRIRTGDIWSI
jgi:hypothetical protein